MPYSSTFMGLNIAMRGLLAQQTALDTTSHNIDNVNTEGYSRQRADLVTADPITVPAFNRRMPGQIGQGVSVNQIQRLRDQYIDTTLRSSLGTTSDLETQLNSLQAIQGAFNEPSDNALGAAMRAFFGALDDVASHPDDISARQAFLQRSGELASQFNQLASNLTAISNESNNRINQSMTDIDSLSQRIATLNTQIGMAVQVGQQPNDLLDTRDKLMDELAQKVNYTYTTNANQQVTITFGTTTPLNLVDPLVAGGWNALPARGSAAAGDLDQAYANGDLTSGQVFADEDMFTTQIPAYMTQLDNLANSIIVQMNAGQAAGFDLTGAAGAPLFGGGSAATIVLALGNPQGVAAASSWVAPGEPGNGANAIAMLQQRSTVQGAPLNDTWEGYYGTIVAGLGTATATTQQNLDDQNLVLDAVTARRESVSGVNLDEEMTNMLRFQHAYNAAARVLTMFDESLDTLINRTGRVGL